MHPNKAQRLEEFKTALIQAEPAAGVFEAWAMMSSVLKEIEDRHNPKEKMTIPPLEFRTTRNYGDGACIYLIGHNVYINGNGAIRITDLFENVFCEKRAQDGRCFIPIADWKCFRNRSQAEQHSKIFNKAKAHQVELINQAKAQNTEFYNQAKAQHLQNLKRFKQQDG